MVFVDPWLMVFIDIKIIYILVYTKQGRGTRTQQKCRGITFQYLPKHPVPGPPSSDDQSPETGAFLNHSLWVRTTAQTPQDGTIRSELLQSPHLAHSHPSTSDSTPRLQTPLLDFGLHSHFANVTRSGFDASKRRGFHSDGRAEP